MFQSRDIESMIPKIDPKPAYHKRAKIKTSVTRLKQFFYICQKYNTTES